MLNFNQTKRTPLKIFLGLLLGAYLFFALFGSTPVVTAFDVETLIRQHYLFPVTEEMDKLLEQGDWEGFFEERNDPHSRHYSPQEAQDYLQSLEGRFGGIGVAINYVDGYTVVVRPLPGTPGEVAGLQTGDKILAVDGVSIVGKPLSRAVTLIRGEPGTAVQLLLEREGSQLTVRIVRAMIEVESVQVEEVSPGLYHVRIYQFAQDTAQDLKEKLEPLPGEVARSFILDLRDNTGGFLSTSLEVAEIFVPAGTLLYREDNAGMSSDDSKGPKVLVDRLVVLVNENTASGAEIVAGAIQARETGLLVGTTTYGKGSVQSLFTLPDGSALKLTVARFLTPDKQVIDGNGLTPDFYIEDPDDQWETALRLIESPVFGELPPLEEASPIEIILLPATGEIYLQGKPVTLRNTYPFFYDGRSYIPLRFFSEALGYDVGWEGTTRSVVITGRRYWLPEASPEDFELKLPIESQYVYLNGEKISLPYPIKHKEGRSYLPVRLAAELLGGQVEWYQPNRRVTITVTQWVNEK